jgi:hypothetical protein
MNAKIFALAALALPWNANAVDAYVCKATVSLRPGGSGDTIRITNQAQNERELNLRLINANAAVQGKSPPEILVPDQSVTRSVAQIFQSASVRFFNPDLLIQISQEVPFDGLLGALVPEFQAVYTNSATRQVVPLLFTCQNLISS